MTREQRVVSEALSRGRLVFPFAEERAALEEQAAGGPLTVLEERRLRDIAALAEQFKAFDEAFNRAVQSGDISAAESAAEGALGLCVDFMPPEDSPEVS